MADTNETQPVEATVQQQGKLKFGVQGLNNPTPMWVTWIFRTEFVLNKAASIYLATIPGLSVDQIKQALVIFTIVDFVVWGLGRFVGVKKSDFEA